MFLSSLKFLLQLGGGCHVTSCWGLAQPVLAQPVQPLDSARLSGLVVRDKWARCIHYCCCSTPLGVSLMWQIFVLALKFSLCYGRFDPKSVI